MRICRVGCQAEERVPQGRPNRTSLAVPFVVSHEAEHALFGTACRPAIMVAMVYLNPNRQELGCAKGLPKNNNSRRTEPQTQIHMLNELTFRRQRKFPAITRNLTDKGNGIQQSKGQVEHEFVDDVNSAPRVVVSKQELLR